MTANSTAPFLSVVLCTYNPRPDYLQRCVDGLKAQTLPCERWEFVVVDNNSQPPLRVSIRHAATGAERRWVARQPNGIREEGEALAGVRGQGTGPPAHRAYGSERDSKGDESRKEAQEEEGIRQEASLPSNLPTFPPFTEIDLSWHADARLVVETLQGLSHARRRGFEEARGELIVNLDDDAVLDPEYLEQVVKLAAKFPFIGAFGCQLRAEFERPPDWPIDDYYGAQRTVSEDIWSNDLEQFATTPAGVGSVVRRAVAEAYVGRMRSDSRWSVLGRTGDKLLSCEDIEIAMTACDLGLGKGVFRDLKLTHLIPVKRMTEDFLCRNAYGNGYSSVVHNYLRFGRVPSRPSIFAKLNRLYRLWRMSPRKRREEMSKDRGLRDARRFVAELKMTEHMSKQAKKGN